MIWSGEYFKCRDCGEIYPYRTPQCPCCGGICDRIGSFQKAAEQGHEKAKEVLEILKKKEEAVQGKDQLFKSTIAKYLVETGQIDGAKKDTSEQKRTNSLKITQVQNNALSPMGQTHKGERPVASDVHVQNQERMHPQSVASRQNQHITVLTGVGGSGKPLTTGVIPQSKIGLWGEVKRCFSIRGRATRKEFLIVNSIAAIFAIPTCVIVAGACVVFVWIRRLHDLSRSGWWLLVLASGIGGCRIANGFSFSFPEAVIWLGWLVLLGWVDSVSRDNDYGSDTKGGGGTRTQSKTALIAVVWVSVFTIGMVLATIVYSQESRKQALQEWTLQLQKQNDVASLVNSGTQLELQGRFDEAAEKYEAAAASGNPDAFMKLGDLILSHRFSQLTPADPDDPVWGYVKWLKSAKKLVARAKVLYEKARQAGCPMQSAYARLAKCEAQIAAIEANEVQSKAYITLKFTSAYKTKQYDVAARLLKSISGDDAEVQFYVAKMYENGWGVPKDDIEATHWYRKSAEQGYCKAQNNLGTKYRDGRGVSKDFTEAMRWFRKAANQGAALAQSNVGMMYRDGNGVKKNYSEAMRWFCKAADQGDALAQLCIAGMYMSGRGVSADAVKAVKWLRKAADQDDDSAQYCLGLCYEKGNGVEKDLQEAMKWYRKAAEQGLKEAKEALARLGVSVK